MGIGCFVGDHAVPGLPLRASIIAIFAAVQLLTLGIWVGTRPVWPVRRIDRPASAAGESTDADPVP
jgi:hypothetical protein